MWYVRYLEVADCESEAKMMKKLRDLYGGHKCRDNEVSSLISTFDRIEYFLEEQTV